MQTFIESIDKFIERTEVEGYRKDLIVFKDFIESKHINNDTWLDYISGISTKTIIESLNYYIESSRVTSVSTAKRYVSAVKEYFSFMFEQNHIYQNTLFNEIGYKYDNEKSFSYQLNKAISQNKELRAKESVAIYDENEVVEFIHVCDEVLSMSPATACIMSKNFTKFVSTLIFKLVIISGTMYRDIITITKSALELKYSTLTINELTFHLPKNLIDQFYKYLEIRESLVNSEHDENDLLFIQFNGSRLPEQTSLIMTHFAGWTARTDYNGLVKYAIINMLNEGIGETIIKQFTGVGNIIYMDCWKYVENNKGFRINRYIDSKIRSIKVFDLL
jgi:site-specific recombinase XerD